MRRNRAGLSSRRQFKLAYLIMAHSKSPQAFFNLQDMIELFDDGQAIIMIHVDAKSPELQLKIFDWLEQRHTDKPQNQVNVFLQKNVFNNIWGHISLVYTQLAGFWELQDLADWEYVINLSCHDYPLRRNNEVYNFLTSPSRKGKVWINHWMQDYGNKWICSRKPTY